MAGKEMTVGLIKAHEQPDRSDWKIEAGRRRQDPLL